LQRRNNYRARADADMSIAICRDFSVILPRLAIMLNQIEGNVNGFVSMFRITVRKSENGDNALPVGGLDITSRFQETVSHVANKLLRGLGKDRRPGVFSEAVFIGNVADYDAHFVSPRLQIERNCAFEEATKFFVRQSVGEEASRQMRTVSPQKD